MPRDVIQIAQPFFGEEEWKVLRDPLQSGWVSQGPKVRELEELFARRHGVKHAIAVSNCTTALHLALLALGVRPGDEVIVPAFTWISSANAVLYCGATPVFADIELRTFNIDPGTVRKKIRKKTRAIMPVHLFGRCADMDALRDVSRSIPLVEDAACASGSAYKGTCAGGLGDVGCFSFHPRKIITTGEGGMITTHSDALARKVNILRNHGADISEEQRHGGNKPWQMPDFRVMGFNYRMTDLQGAIGVVQLGRLDHFIEERQKWAEYYQAKLQKISWLQLPPIEADYPGNWQSYVALLDEKKSPLKRDDFLEYLSSKGISARPGTHAVPYLNFYRKKFGFKNADFPASLRASRCSVALPLHNRMSPGDYEYVVEMIERL